MRNFVNNFNDRFKLGGVVHGPSVLRFFGLNIIQDEDCTMTIHADDKLQALEPYPISRPRRCQLDDVMNEIEVKSFMSINTSIAWLGITASPYFSFFSSYLQQKMSQRHVGALISQFLALKKMKKSGTVTSYTRPTECNLKPTLVAFAGASHTKESSQQCYIVGLVYGNMGKGFVFHHLS